MTSRSPCTIAFCGHCAVWKERKSFCLYCLAAFVKQSAEELVLKSEMRVHITLLGSGWEGEYVPSPLTAELARRGDPHALPRRLRRAVRAATRGVARFVAVNPIRDAKRKNHHWLRLYTSQVEASVEICAYRLDSHTARVLLLS